MFRTWRIDQINVLPFDTRTPIDFDIDLGALYNVGQHVLLKQISVGWQMWDQSANFLRLVGISSGWITGLKAATTNPTLTSPTIGGTIIPIEGLKLVPAGGYVKLDHPQEITASFTLSILISNSVLFTALDEHKIVVGIEYDLL